MVTLMIQFLIGRAQDSVVVLRDAVFETGIQSPSSMLHVIGSFTHVARILTYIAGKPKRDKLG